MSGGLFVSSTQGGGGGGAFFGGGWEAAAVLFVLQLRPLLQQEEGSRLDGNQQRDEQATEDVGCGHRCRVPADALRGARGLCVRRQRSGTLAASAAFSSARATARSSARRKEAASCWQDCLHTWPQHGPNRSSYMQRLIRGSHEIEPVVFCWWWAEGSGCQRPSLLAVCSPRCSLHRLPWTEASAPMERYSPG